MPRNQGTSRKGKPKKGERAAGMGRALTKSQQARYRPKQNGSSRGAGMAMAPGTYSIGLPGEQQHNNTKSLLEMDDLTDFLAQANMAGREFESERERHIVLDATGQEYRSSQQQPRVTWQDTQQPKKPEFTFAELSVPRRPPWDDSTSAEELDVLEKDSFLEWRRAIAKREEELLANAASNVSVTPFEKNLEVWRQLWRVMERCSCLIQIVDGRNPLFYLSQDLRTYASQELGKPMILLINKSDYLSEKQRNAWHVYLKAQGWDHVFFSAYEEQQKLDDDAARERKRSAIVASEFVDDDDEAKESNGERDGGESEAPEGQSDSESINATNPRDSVGVAYPLTRQKLMDWLYNFAIRYDCKPDERYNDRIQFGMVGFPNVGKSSVINVLMGNSKHTHGLVRVAVASQPGKTKHFQTLLLPSPSPPIMLCDCPGLVFPSFVSSTADLIAAGVYPIAQMRDHWPVVQLICQRIPREVLNAHYGIVLPTPSLQDLKERGLAESSGEVVLPPPTAEELLATYCIARSMLAAASGVPDYQRAARVVIKDYADGKLLFCHPPPQTTDEQALTSDLTEDDYHRETLFTALRQTKKLRSKLTPLLAEQQQQRQKSVDGESEVDTQQDGVVAGLGDSELDGIEEDLDLLNVVGGFATSDTTEQISKNNGNKRGKKHKTMHKHGKKGRKDRNKDPYGCHADLPNDMLMETSGASAGVIVNAGKYGRRGYTRPNYVGVKNALQYPSKSSANEQTRS